MSKYVLCEYRTKLHTPWTRGPVANLRHSSKASTPSQRDVQSSVGPGNTEGFQARCRRDLCPGAFRAYSRIRGPKGFQSPPSCKKKLQGFPWRASCQSSDRQVFVAPTSCGCWLMLREAVLKASCQQLFKTSVKSTACQLSESW